MSTSKGDPAMDPDFWQRWSAPDISGEAGGPVRRTADLRPPTAEDLEVLRQAAFEEGFAAGHSEGLRRGTAEVKTNAQHLRALIASLARPLEQLDARVEEELVALSVALVRQLVRREIRTDRGVVVAAVREALGVLPLSAREVAVKLHPEDAAVVREAFSDEGGEAGAGWRILESPAVTRGGCVVVTSTSEVDATVERRLGAALCHVFGGDRVSDAGAADCADGGANGAGGSSAGVPEAASPVAQAGGEGAP